MKWHIKKKQIPDFNCSGILNSCRFCGFQCIAIQQLSGAPVLGMAIVLQLGLWDTPTLCMVISIVISTTPPKVREKNTTSVSNFMNWRSDEWNFHLVLFLGDIGATNWWFILLSCCSRFIRNRYLFHRKLLA